MGLRPKLFLLSNEDTHIAIFGEFTVLYSVFPIRVNANKPIELM